MKDCYYGSISFKKHPERHTLGRRIHPHLFEVEGAI
jgi:hypothetical protein